MEKEVERDIWFTSDTHFGHISKQQITPMIAAAIKKNFKKTLSSPSLLHTTPRKRKNKVLIGKYHFNMCSIGSPCKPITMLY